jgi:hypothetical protein
MNRLLRRYGEKGLDVAGNVRYVFTSSNTANGFYTFIPELIEGLKKVYILKGPAGSGKSTFIRAVGQAMSELGYEVEFWISAIEPVNPDGVFIPQLKVAVINGSLPKAIDPKYPGAVGELINLGEFIKKNQIKKEISAISNHVSNVEKYSCSAYNKLKKAMQVKEKFQQEYSDCLDIDKLHILIRDLNEEIFQEQPREPHYFAGVLTADGMVNYLDELSSGCTKRYIIRGPFINEKSMVLAGIASSAREKGLTVEYYHCGLNPDSLRMIIIKSLKVAVINLENAEITFKPWDVIYDVKSCLAISDGESLDINEFKRSYESLLMDAKDELENVYHSLVELKKLYSNHMDFALVDRKRDELISEISQKLF